MAAGLMSPYGNNTGNRITRNDSTAATAPKQRGGDPNNPYRGGLMTDFDWLKNTNTVKNGGQDGVYDYTFANKKLTDAGQMDRDVQGATAAYNERIHPLAGTNGAEQSALFDMYLGRINQRNALAEQIQSSEGEGKNAAIHDIYGQADQALGQGLKSTRENYNNRGLLYSGLREGGEGKVRAGVGAKLSGDIANTNREFANSAQKAKQAYASIGMANQQQNIELANQAFETTSKNNVARMQAYQQFAGGLGGLAAYGYSAYNSGGGQPTNKTSLSGGAEPDVAWQSEPNNGGRQGLVSGGY